MRLAICLALLVLASACSGGTKRTETTVTSDVESWEGAEAIAKAYVKRKSFFFNRPKVERAPGPRYMFWAHGYRGVLVHHGEVLTGRGPEVAASYLRDVGIVAGPGPTIDPVLRTLFVLRALPEVEGFGEEAYVSPDGSGPLKDLHARIEREPGRATIVLFYPGDADSGYFEAGAPDMPEADLRAVTRMSLAITESPGDPVAWTREDFTWEYPRDD
jgi:hypothetical protein